MPAFKSASLLEIHSYEDQLKEYLNVKSVSSSENNSPLLKTRALENTESALGVASSRDSFLTRFTNSIECMIQSSDFGSRYRQMENSLRSRPSNDSLDSDDSCFEKGKDFALNKTKPLSANSVVDTKFEYNPENANLWVELTKIDMSPVLPQRKSRTFCESAQEVLNKIDPASLQRYPLSTRSMAHDQVIEASCTKSLYENKECVQFKFQYLIMTERLKVTVIKASNMFGKEKPDAEVSMYAEVCLMPGKLQRQFSKLKKASSNPVFDYVAYFKGISLFEMHQMCLRVKIMAKGRLLKNPRVIGEVTVSLDDFDLVSETVLEENFNTRIGSRSGSRYGFRSVVVQ